MEKRSHSIVPAAAVVALLLAGAAGCGGGSSAKSVPPSAVAVVGDDTIARADLSSMIASAKRRSAAKKAPFPAPGTAAYVKVRSSAIRYLVQQSELEQKSVDLGVKPVTANDVNRKLELVKRQLFGELPSHFKPELAREGLTEAELKADLRDGLLEDRLFAKVNADTTVTQAEIQRYYDANKTQYGHPAIRDIRHILVASRTLADKIEGELADGADFATLVKKYSKDIGSAGNGGKVTITQGHTIAEFEKIAFDLKPNEISAPVQTAYGWHIIQAIGPVHQSTFTPLKYEEKRIRSALLKRKKQARWTKFLADTKKEFAASIRYRAGFAPTPASS